MKTQTASRKRLFLILILLTAITTTACSHLIATQMESLNLGLIKGVQQVDRWQKRFCDAEHNCILYYDLSSNITDQEITLDFTFHHPNNSASRAADYQVLKLPALSKEAPLFVLFSGYGASKEVTLLSTGFWLRSLGFQVLIFPGPTEYKEFNYNLNAASFAQKIIAKDDSSRDVLAYGYSMGAVAVTELNLLRELAGEPPLQAAILSAPMLDFNDAALRVLADLKKNHFWMRFVSDKAFKKAISLLPKPKHSLSVLERTENLPEKTLFLLGTADEVVPYQAFNALRESNKYQIELLENRTHIGMGFNNLLMRTYMSTWLGRQGYLLDKVSVQPGEGT